MNNNNSNRNNNRRRGRGNNNRPQGGGQQLNRVDSRARGNAPQMLEKYRKLASDAHLNGDRVQAEYYLQFADHYFRVIADTRTRQEEQRGRRDERPGEGGYDESDDGEYGNDGDLGGFDQPMTYRREEPREAREPRQHREPRQDDGNREPRGFEQRGPQRPHHSEVQPAAEPADEARAEGGHEFEPAANPFTRNTRGLRPRREREPRPAADHEHGHDHGHESAEASGLDPSILPPAIAESLGAHDESEAEAAPAPRRRGRPRRTPIADDGGSFEVVGG